MNCRLGLWTGEKNIELLGSIGGELGRSPEVKTATFSADSKSVLAFSGADLYSWPVAEGELNCVSILDAPTRLASISSELGLLISASESALTATKIETKKSTWSLKLDGVEVLALGGRSVAAYSSGGELHVVDIANGKVKNKIAVKDVSALAVDQSGKSIFTSTEGGVACWSPASGKTEWKKDGVAGESGLSISVTADGTQIAIGGESDEVTILDARTGKVVHTLQPHKKLKKPANKTEKSRLEYNLATVGTSFSPDGRLLACVDRLGSVRLWDVKTGELTSELKVLRSQPSQVLFSGDGRYLLAVGTKSRALLWELDSLKRLWTVGHDSDVVALALTGDESKVFSASLDGTVRRWDANFNETGCFRITEGLINDMVLTLDENLIVAADSEGGVIAVDATSGKQKWETQLGKGKSGFKGVDVLEVSPDGKHIYAAGPSIDKGIVVLDAANGKKTGKIEFEHDDGPLDVKVFKPSPDGKSLALAPDEGLFIANAKSGKVTCQMQGYEGAAPSLAFSEDGSRLLSGSSENSGYLFDVSSGKKRAKFSGHESNVHGIMFLGSEDRVLTFGGDNTIRIWQVSGGKELAEFGCSETYQTHTFYRNAVKTSSDGSRLFVGTYGGGILRFAVGPSLVGNKGVTQATATPKTRISTKVVAKAKAKIKVKTKTKSKPKAKTKPKTKSQLASR